MHRRLASILCVVMGLGGASPATARTPDEAPAPDPDPRAPPPPAALAYPADPIQPSKDAARRGKTHQPAPAPRVEPSTVAGQPLNVAVGLAPEAPGSKAERAMLDRLEAAARKSTNPKTVVRRLRAGVGDGARVCGERRDDLVLQIGYLPDREEPVILPYDCRLSEALGVRSLQAADDSRLVAVLWQEHQRLVDTGARERRTVGRLSPTARTALVATAVIVLVGAGLGLVLASTLRDQRVVLRVSP